MEPVTYRDFIVGYIHHYPYDEPIYTEKVVDSLTSKFDIQSIQARKIANVNLKRLHDENSIERFQKGIYYKTTITPFGKMELNPYLVVRDKYIRNNENIIGYETGASFLNHIGLTTQIPKYKYIATNLCRRGNEKREKLHVILRKPPIKVTKDNYSYLQILDAIEDKNKFTIDTNNPMRIYLSYIQNHKLDAWKLFALASKYYSKGVLSQLCKLAESAIDEITS